jgi:hypothetical protein
LTKSVTPPTPVLLHLVERCEVDLKQHWDDHQPDQDRNGQVDLRDFELAQDLERPWEPMSERDPMMIQRNTQTVR